MAKSRAQKRAQKAKKRRDDRKRSGSRPVRRVGGATPAAAAPTAEELAAIGYNADENVEAASWLALDERERLSRIAKFHSATLKKSRMPPSMQRHSAMHAIVETQIAEGAPPQAREALARLQSEGMSRHDAIHAIGWLATEHMRVAVAKQRPVDDKAYAVELGGLTVRSWLKMAGLKGV